MNLHPRSFPRFDPDHCEMYNFYVITKTNLELGLSDMDAQDLEELDKLQVVNSAVTDDDVSL